MTFRGLSSRSTITGRTSSASSVHSQRSTYAMTASSTSTIRSVCSRTAHDSGAIDELRFVDEEKTHLLDDLHQRHRAFLRDAHCRREHFAVELIAELAAGRGLDASRELLDGKAPDPFAVHPVELRPVESCSRVGHPIEIERGHELDGTHDLLAVVSRSPPQERDVVHQRLGEITVVQEVLERDRAMALRQLRPRCGVDDQRKVRVLRHVGRAQRGAQRQHPMGRVDEVLAADHLGDPHLEVVDRVGQEEDRGAIGPHDHEVVDQRPLDLHLTADQVGEAAHAVIGGAEPQRARTALGGQRRHARRTVRLRQ